MAKYQKFDTVEQAVNSIKEMRDDIDAVELPLHSGPFVAGGVECQGSFMQVRYCSGASSLISVDVAEQLLNDGILHGLRVPIRLKVVE